MAITVVILRTSCCWSRQTPGPWELFEEFLRNARRMQKLGPQEEGLRRLVVVKPLDFVRFCWWIMRDLMRLNGD